MCNRYRLSAKQAAVMRASGFEPPYPEDEIHPVPREILPTGEEDRAARSGRVIGPGQPALGAGRDGMGLLYPSAEQA